MLRERADPGLSRGGRKSDDGPSKRQLRVAEEIRHALAALFARREFRDPDLASADITVNEVRMSPDLRHAIVFVSRLGRSDMAALLPALRRVEPYLRREISRAVRLKFAPKLHFEIDESTAHVMRIAALMKTVEGGGW